MAASPVSSLEALERTERLDLAVRAFERIASAVPRDKREVLRGDWLGHPLHPALTDLPIGFWTSAWALDLLGGRRCAPAATVLVGLGVVSAVPTAAAGLVDWAEIPREKQRVGVVHAACNLAATAAYTASFVARCRGLRGRGVLWGFVGAGVATIGGYLGGHLVFDTEEDQADDASWDDLRTDADRYAALSG